MFYERVEDRESSDTDEWEKYHPNILIRTRWQPSFWTYLNFGFFVASLLCLVTSFSMIRKYGSANDALRRVNTYSPIIEEFPFSFQDVKTNSSLFNDPYSIYKGDPSPEVDAAWMAIGHTQTMHFSADEIRSLGKDPEISAKVPEDWGYGKDRYFGVIDGQHLIHCLNVLRQWAHYDYYWEDKWGHMSKAPPVHSAHRTHCVGVLLDALTCQPSLNIFTYYWMDSQKAPYPDFDIYRKCQNHNELIQWQRETWRGIDDELIDKNEIPRPADAKVQPDSPQLERLKGWVWNGSFPM